MPSLTPLTSREHDRTGYNDRDFVNVLNQLRDVAKSLESGVAFKIGAWLQTQLDVFPAPLHILSIFAGGANSEMGLAMLDSVARLTVSDASQAAVESVQEALETHGDAGGRSQSLRSKVDYAVMDFPLAPEAVLPNTYDMITCLGVSFFHLPTSAARLATLRQIYRMLKPGGALLLDNKNWNGGLEEERDPMTVYALPDNRLLLASYEYPRPGTQLYHLQLMQVQGENTDGIARSYATEKRWVLTGYPVHSRTLVEEMDAAGFIDCRIHDKDTWPTAPGNGKAAYYHLLIAHKSKTETR